MVTVALLLCGCAKVSVTPLGTRVGSYNGQLFTALGDRVLLIACNQ